MRLPLLAAAALVAASLTAPAADAADGNVGPPAERITVTLSNFTFDPSVIELHHGRAYVLHIVNGARGGHNFQANAFFADAALAPGDRDKVTGGKIELKGGEAVDLRLTAPQAPATYPLKCTHFLHAGFGMKGKIVVD
ncbi:cupredoxin domain-containing protein [Novosphingobium sp. KN65.2]|uniref:cupredoxin domain-containing protein n=1 Tax=Novosphingobium sp. KN65.2 TaxID=1478134 RepID=UPI0005E98328|nr:cupredoxin domain-containing protein [Novosphingobium sp. KN65.2]CDO35611.1 exported hypothetical protein [Novosphingobium sp. KN65.2]